MKLSVIVPVYGVEKYIARCAESLLRQDYADKELIFVDDASPDRSVAVLQELLSHYPDQQVTLLRHSENRGLAAARRTGMEAAAAELAAAAQEAAQEAAVAEAEAKGEAPAEA